MARLTMRCVRRLLLMLPLVVLAAPLTLGAQRRAREPKRPKLTRDADPNDWRSWQDCAFDTHDGRVAQACFYWAHRLDPSRPEPLFGEFLVTALEDSAAMRRALLLDPFAYHVRVLAFEGDRRINPFSPAITRAWAALKSGDYFGASRWFGVHLDSMPRDVDAQWGIAIALHYRQRFDSSAAHLGALLGRLVPGPDPLLVDPYHSPVFVSYMQGDAWLAAGRRDSARAALRRSVAGDSSFYFARMRLAELALDDGDSATAAREWAAVLPLIGSDPVAKRRHARYLLRSGNPAGAEWELVEVLSAEPDWVDAMFDIAEAVEAQGSTRRPEAIAAWERWLTHAPLAESDRRAAAAARLSRLRAG